MQFHTCKAELWEPIDVFPAPFWVAKKLNAGDGIEREPVSSRQDPAGFEVRTELWRTGRGEAWTEMKSAYTPEGAYVGDVKTARFLYKKRKIKPQLAPGCRVCSIGKGEGGRWYGWSHRAICGFGVGDKVYEEGYAPDGDKTLFTRHGRKTIRTDEDAKKAAIAFARSVS